jgi:hypothetical protein
MADELEFPKSPTVYGLWNDALGEWFNPGTRKPYFATREDAMRMIPLALRQYSMGKWEVREYPLDLSGLDGSTENVTIPDPARPGPA